MITTKLFWRAQNRLVHLDIETALVEFSAETQGIPQVPVKSRLLRPVFLTVFPKPIRSWKHYRTAQYRVQS